MGASSFLLAPTWLLHSKTGEWRQGREAFILTLARHSPVLLFLRNGLHQLTLQTTFHIWVYLLMGLTALIDYCPQTQLVDISIIVLQEIVSGFATNESNGKSLEIVKAKLAVTQ